MKTIAWTTVNVEPTRDLLKWNRRIIGFEKVDAAFTWVLILINGLKVKILTGKELQRQNVHELRKTIGREMFSTPHVLITVLL